MEVLAVFMYKLVKTKEDLDLFHSIKKIVWESKNFEMEWAKSNSAQFLFYMDGEAGGTFEFTPYMYSSDYIKEIFDPHLLPSMRVVETDSFAVLPKFRGKLGREIVSFMIAYAQFMGFTHGIGLADEKIVRSFPNTYGIPTVSVRDKFFYKGEYVTPVIFDFLSVYTNLHADKYAWFIEPIEYEVVLING